MSITLDTRFRGRLALFEILGLARRQQLAYPALPARGAIVVHRARAFPASRARDPQTADALHARSQYYWQLALKTAAVECSASVPPTQRE